MGYSTTGKHYKTVNGKMIAETISLVTNSPIVKTRGKITWPPMSVLVIGVKTSTPATLIMYMNSTLAQSSYQNVSMSFTK